jgi:hypothetical protein
VTCSRFPAPHAPHRHSGFKLPATAPLKVVQFFRTLRARIRPASLARLPDDFSPPRTPGPASDSAYIPFPSPLVGEGQGEGGRIEVQRAKFGVQIGKTPPDLDLGFWILDSLPCNLFPSPLAGEGPG